MLPKQKTRRQKSNLPVLLLEVIRREILVSWLLNKRFKNLYGHCFVITCCKSGHKLNNFNINSGRQCSSWACWSIGHEALWTKGFSWPTPFIFSEDLKNVRIPLVIDSLGVVSNSSKIIDIMEVLKGCAQRQIQELARTGSCRVLT